VAFVVFVVVALGREGSKRTTTTTSTTLPPGPPNLDAKQTSCTYGNSAATAGVTVTNNTGQKMNYVVKVVFVDGKQLFSGGTATVDNLPPRARKDLIVVGLSTAVPPKHLSCGIVDVQRFP
jgi:hypothetical protein